MKKILLNCPSLNLLVMRYWKWILLVLGIALLAGFWYARPLLRVGAGYAAKMACSCHYVQGRALDAIQSTDLSFSALKYVRLTHEAERREVKASFWGLVTQRARYVAGRGCVLLADANAPVPASLAAVEEVPPPTLLPVYDTLPAGLDTAALNGAVARAFAPLPGGGTRGVVILHDGRLVGERYAPGFDRDTPLLGWSMTKSVTNALVGLLVADGKLSLDRDRLFPEWADDERAAVTLADLLHMNSGLVWDEAYGGVSDATRMLYFQPDMAAYARDRPLNYPPGTHWNYSSGTTNLLSRLIRNTLNDDAAYAAFPYERLFRPLGMASARIECDQSGTFVGSSYGWATARDWGRFAQLYLQDGVWNGRRLLPEGWVDYSCRVAAGSEGVYGAQVWLPDPAELPDAPADLFMFRGFQDQRIVMVPSRRCVMVRLGMNDDKSFALQDFVREVLAALPP